MNTHLIKYSSGLNDDYLAMCICINYMNDGWRVTKNENEMEYAKLAALQIELQALNSKFIKNLMLSISLIMPEPCNI